MTAAQDFLAQFRASLLKILYAIRHAFLREGGQGIRVNLRLLSYCLTFYLRFRTQRNFSLDIFLTERIPRFPSSYLYRRDRNLPATCGERRPAPWVSRLPDVGVGTPKRASLERFSDSLCQACNNFISLLRFDFSVCLNVRYARRIKSDVYWAALSTCKAREFSLTFRCVTEALFGVLGSTRIAA